LVSSEKSNKNSKEKEKKGKAKKQGNWVDFEEGEKVESDEDCTEK
jgi:hypothetical protein